ncbi:MAG TPA: rhomboid family intramembrane serine protease, partial [Pseudomonadales bacterium]|nr:rhomboid family intramembrane serine protease [Pseudomonadales bacterium]
EAWRLWTGNLVHFSTSHTMSNLVLLLAVTILAQRAFGSRTTLIALLVAAPLISLGLSYLVPNLTVYRGTSALSAFLGVAVGMHLWYQTPRLRFALAAVGMVAIVAMCLEAAGWFAGFSNLPAGIRVAWQAHLMAGLGAITWVFCRNAQLLAGTTLGMPQDV